MSAQQTARGARAFGLALLARTAGLRAVALLERETGAPDWWNVGIAATDYPELRRIVLGHSIWAWDWPVFATIAGRGMTGRRPPCSSPRPRIG